VKCWETLKKKKRKKEKESKAKQETESEPGHEGFLLRDSLYNRQESQNREDGGNCKGMDGWLVFFFFLINKILEKRVIQHQRDLNL
jgi:hypothetical protein